MLLDSAEHAVRTRGFDGFSYADLAADVGIRKASIHHHFPTKADLALALIARYAANFSAFLEQVTALQPTGGARLSALVGAYRSSLEGGSKLCLCVALCTNRDSLSPEVLARLDGFHVNITAWLSDVFVLGKSDGSIACVADHMEEAHACLAQLEGAQLIARAVRDSARFDAAMAKLFGRIR